MSLIQKPEPLVVAGKALYTLTSYDPVEVEVQVASVTDGEIDLAIENMVADLDGTAENLEDSAWIKEHFPGASSMSELRDQMRQSLSSMNMQLAEEQKEQKCLETLTERLGQSVPQAFIDSTAEQMRMSFIYEAAQAGMEVEDYIAKMGMSQDTFNAMIAEQARVLSEQNAALDAYASEKKLTVTDEEIPHIMRIPAEREEAFFEEAKSTGQLERLREAAIRTKAIGAVVAECSCTYQHETPQEAAKRLESLKTYMQVRREALDRSKEQSKHEDTSTNADNNTGDLKIV